MNRARLIAAALTLAACGGASADRAEPPARAQTQTQAEDGARALPGPPIFDYTEPPYMLVYAATGGWRHEDGIAGGNLALLEIGRGAGLTVVTSEDAAYFTPESLSRFEVVALNSATGVTLDGAQRDAFAAWVEGGGAVLALHGSGDASHEDWSWYQETLIGPLFIGHPMDPQFQAARVEPLTDHPVMDGIGAFDHVEEWYSFDGLPGDGFLTVAGVAETGFAPVLREGAAPSADPADHPVVWVACPGTGRSVYSALGHSADAFGGEAHRRMLGNALGWLRADGGAGCP